MPGVRASVQVTGYPEFVNRKAARCGKWLPVAQENCPLPEGHSGKCRTARGMTLHYNRSGERTKRMIAERQAKINAYKMERGCVMCGYAENPVALDLDHRDPDLKVDNVSRLIRYASWPSVLAELDKCAVLCANCHRIKTYYDDESQPRGQRRRPAGSTS